MEKYSVLMSVYEREKPEYIIMSMDSMLTQTVAPDEIVLVKDGPLTAALEAVVDDYQRRYPDILHVINSDVNIGLGLALNLGLNNCRNELVARMDADDISLPTRCEKLLEAFRSDPELVIVGTMIDEFSEDPGLRTASRVVPVSFADIYQFAKRRSPFNHPTVMYKKSMVLQCGGYADMRRNQDVELFGRMLFAGDKGANLGETLLLFRANKSLLARRRSWANTRSYIEAVLRLWRIGYSSLWDLILVSLGQIIMFLSPLAIQKLLYKLYLRKN